MESKVTQMGMDCHKKFSTVTAQDGTGRVVFRRRLDHRQRELMRAEIGSWPAGTPVVLEGTFGWGWMCDELQAGGMDPHLTSGLKIKGWRQSRGKAKNNRLDADLLAELWSERSKWWEVWLAPPEVRQQREWLRYRMGLVQIQTMLKNRAHAVLHRHGILHPYSDVFGKSGVKFLGQLCNDQDATLPESGRECLRGQLLLLKQVRKQIAQATRELRKQVKASVEARRWDSLPGIGWVLAHTIQAEIGMIERFGNSRSLASYSMLAPWDNDSGDEDPEATPQGRHVRHIGRRTLKWAFINAAHSAVKKSKHFRELFDRRTNGGKKDCHRGYIAVAHALCNIGYACVTKQRNYSEAPPARPGSSGALPSHDRTRPEAGQPEPAMVAASP